MRVYILAVMAIYIAIHLVLLVKLLRLTKSTYVKLLTSLVLLMLASAFPLGEFLNSRSHTMFSKSVLLLGYYYLPLLLYLLIMLLLLQLFSASTRWFLTGIRPTVTGRVFQMRSMLVMLLVSLVILIMGHINFNTTRITKFQTEIPAKASTMDSLKIAMAADLHISELTSKKFMEQFVKKINALHPDIVLFPGDVLDRVDDTEELGYYEKKLNEIQSKYGVFASPGNHEHYGRSRLEDIPFFKNAGIDMLIDEDTVINHGFRLAGLDYQDHDSIKVTSMFSRMQADTIPEILMRHSPDNFELNQWINPEVQVSGHTHNGQLWPLNLVISALYELPWGNRVINNCQVFVTCGAQGWGPQVRTTGHSEIMEIDLRFVKENN